MFDRGKYDTLSNIKNNPLSLPLACVKSYRSHAYHRLAFSTVIKISHKKNAEPYSPSRKFCSCLFSTLVRLAFLAKHALRASLYV